VVQREAEAGTIRAVTFLVILVAMLWSDAPRHSSPPSSLPEVANYDAIQRTIQAAGPKIRVVNLWATWCGPCVAEMADLQKIADRFPESIDFYGNDSSNMGDNCFESDGGGRNGVFDLAGPPSVDALVVMSGAIGNRIGPERLARYCDRYRPLPMCSIAVQLGEMSSVCIDNESGIRAVNEHPVPVHGKRRIDDVQVLRTRVIQQPMQLVRDCLMPQTERRAHQEFPVNELVTAAVIGHPF